MIIGISMGQEICLIHGQVSLSFLYWKRNLQTDISVYVVWWEIDEKTANIQTRSFMARRTLGENGKERQAEGRGKSGHMKSFTSITHENCEGSISSTVRTRSLRRPSKTRVRSWKHQWLPLCPAKLWGTIRIVGMVHPIKWKQNLRVFWKLMNPQECVWEILYRIIIKTILQEKATIHCNITIWYTNLFPCLKPWKFLQRRQQWTRNEKNWRKFRSGTGRKSEVRKRWSMKQRRRAPKFILHHWWKYVIWKMLNWRQNTKNTKVELYSEVILRKTIRGLMQYLQHKDHQHLKWQPPKSWISSPDCQVAMDKQQTQYQLTARKNGRCSQIIQNSKIGVSRHLDSSTTTEMA